jgi:hypothetical protein
MLEYLPKELLTGVVLWLKSEDRKRLSHVNKNLFAFVKALRNRFFPDRKNLLIHAFVDISATPSFIRTFQFNYSHVVLADVFCR